MRGTEVRFNFSSADAQTAAAITIRDADNIQRTLSGNQRLCITTAAFRTAAIGLVALFDDADNDGNIDAGETLIHLTGASLRTAHMFAVPLFCGKGRVPKIKAAAAGQTEFDGTGFIIEA